MGRHNLTADYYDAVYQKQIVNPRLRREAMRMPEVVPHILGSVLDLGCGLGEMANLLGDREYLGVDFSPVAIQYAKENTKNPNAKFQLVDFQDGLSLGRFDTVLLLEVLEHVQNPIEIVGLAQRHARKRIVSTVPIDIPDRAHVKSQWDEADLVTLFGELAVCEPIRRLWWLAVKVVETEVSVCMIARNEEDILATAIESTEGLADEIVILDTGSTDGTVALAKSLGCEVLTGGDRMNKGESRNRAIDAARGKWVVILDADECIADPIGLRKFLLQSDGQAVYIRLAYMNDDNEPTLTYPQMRCWRKDAFRYRYRAHEVPMPTDGWGKLERTEFVWEHRPPPSRAWKSQYTLDRLLLDVEENPGAARPLYYLGRQYTYRGEWEKGIEFLARYLGMPGHDEADAWHCLSKCHAGMDNEAEQIRTLYRACAAQPGRREWWGALASIYHAKGQDNIAAGLLKCMLEIPLPERSYASHYWHGPHTHDLLARCFWKLKRYKEGRVHARKAVAMAPDSKRLHRNLKYFEDVLAPESNNDAVKIFLTGCAKSGTTLLCRLFYAFENVEVLDDEIHLIPFAAATTGAAFLVGKRHRYSLFSEHLSREQLEQQVRLLRESGVRVVNIIRDGRDVIASDRAGWVEPRRWLMAMQHREEFSDLIDIEIRYEDLVRTPNLVQQQVASALGLRKIHDWSDYPSFVPAQDRDIGKYRLRPIDTVSIGRGHLAYKDILTNLEQSFEQELDKAGYA